MTEGRNIAYTKLSSKPEKSPALSRELCSVAHRLTAAAATFKFGDPPLFDPSIVLTTSPSGNPVKVANGSIQQQSC